MACVSKKDHFLLAELATST